MDWQRFEQLRVKGFTTVRRGYDTREVDRFLDSLREWLETDAATDLGDEAVKRKLELVGQSTAHILLTTEQEAQELRRRTEAECAEVRANAEAAATELRTRSEDESRRMVEAATEQARQNIAEGEARRAEIEAVVSELVAQRDAALDQLEELRGQLLATVSKHTSRTKPGPRNAEGRRKRANIAKEEENAEAPAEAPTEVSAGT